MLIVRSLALAMLTTVVVLTAGSSIESVGTTESTVASGASPATPPFDLPAVPPGAEAAGRCAQAVPRAPGAAQPGGAGKSARRRADVGARAHPRGRRPGGDRVLGPAVGGRGRDEFRPAGSAGRPIGLPLGFALVAGITAGIEGTVCPSPAEVALVILGAVATAGLPAALPVLAQRRSLVQALAVE